MKNTYELEKAPLNPLEAMAHLLEEILATWSPGTIRRSSGMEVEVEF